MQGMKSAALAALCLLLNSCAAAMSSGPEIYRIGELEVRLYKSRESLAQALPPILSAVEAMSVGDKQIRVLGYFDRQQKRIYSIDDPRVLLHELKHYLEPDWRHEIGCAQLTDLDQQTGSSCGPHPLSDSARVNAPMRGDLSPESSL